MRLLAFRKRLIFEYNIKGEEELYIGSVIIAYAVMYVSLFYTTTNTPCLRYIGKNLSKYIYYYHPLIYCVGATIGIKTGWLSIYVVVASVLISLGLYIINGMLCRVWKKWTRKNELYHKR